MHVPRLAHGLSRQSRPPARPPACRRCRLVSLPRHAPGAARRMQMQLCLWRRGFAAAQQQLGRVISEYIRSGGSAEAPLRPHEALAFGLPRCTKAVLVAHCAREASGASMAAIDSVLLGRHSAVPRARARTHNAHTHGRHVCKTCRLSCVRTGCRIVQPVRTTALSPCKARVFPTARPPEAGVATPAGVTGCSGARSPRLLHVWPSATHRPASRTPTPAASHAVDSSSRTDTVLRGHPLR